tara:strand:+ start:265 stop:777 length:513 start_codon:yes stop_codon:yes gene_type:complete
MEELIKELKMAIENKLYFISMNTALLIPDICSALQSSNGQTTGKKYANWFNEYLGEKYNDILLGSDIWKLRCASLHQGKYNSEFDSFDKIIFQPSGNMVMHRFRMTDIGGIKGTAILLNIEIFITDIMTAYEEWILNMKENPFYEKNLKQSFKYNPLGVSPYVVGTPIIA